jgi:hypothetical protein
VSHLYEDVEGLNLRKVKAFNAVDMREITVAYARGIRKLHCEVVTDFGPEVAVLTRHAGGKYIHIGVVTNCLPCEWEIEDEVLEKVLA